MVWKKTMCIIGVAVVSVFVVYPLLHELGHCAVGWCFGGVPLAGRLLGNPFVLFSDRMLPRQISAVALGGLVGPWVSFFLPYRRFWCWFVGWCVKWVCVLSFGISGMGMYWFSYTNLWQQEDIVKVMQGFWVSHWVWFGAIWICFFIGLCILWNSGGVKRVLEYLLGDEIYRDEHLAENHKKKKKKRKTPKKKIHYKV